MIKTERKEDKVEKPKTLEEIVADQAEQIQILKTALDDVIFNGGAL